MKRLTTAAAFMFLLGGPASAQSYVDTVMFLLLGTTATQMEPMEISPTPFPPLRRTMEIIDAKIEDCTVHYLIKSKDNREFAFESRAKVFWGAVASWDVGRYEDGRLFLKLYGNGDEEIFAVATVLLAHRDRPMKKSCKTECGVDIFPQRRDPHRVRKAMEYLQKTFCTPDRSAF